MFYYRNLFLYLSSYNTYISPIAHSNKGIYMYINIESSVSRKHSVLFFFCSSSFHDVLREDNNNVNIGNVYGKVPEALGWSVKYEHLFICCDILGKRGDFRAGYWASLSFFCTFPGAGTRRGNARDRQGLKQEVNLGTSSTILRTIWL